MADEEAPKPTVQWSGAWGDNGPDGKGVMTFPPPPPPAEPKEDEPEPVGDKFEGTYVQGAKHGFGRYTWGATGCYFEGTYDNDRRKNGTMTYPDGSRYEGDFNISGPAGRGCYYYANGDVYMGDITSTVGGWQEDRRVLKSGEGSYYHKATESQYIGTWDDGKFVSGVWALKDGSRFAGTFDAATEQLTFKAAASGLMQSGTLGASAWTASESVCPAVWC